MATTRIDSKEAPSPSVAATPSQKMPTSRDNINATDNQSIKISNNRNSPSPSRKSKTKRTISSSFKGAGTGKPVETANAHANNAKDDSSSNTPSTSTQRDDTTTNTATAIPSPATQASTRQKEPREPRAYREKKTVGEGGLDSRPRVSQGNSSHDSTTPSSSSGQYNHHPNSSSHSYRGSRGRGGGSSLSGVTDRHPTSSEPSDGTASNRSYDSAARFAASGGRGRGGYLSGHSSRGRRGNSTSGLGRGAGGDRENGDGEDGLRGRKPERRSQPNNYKGANLDSTASMADTPTTQPSKSDTATTKDSTSTNGGLPTHRSSTTSGVSEFKRAQQLVTRSPRSPRSPRRGFDRGDAKNISVENIPQENPASSAGAKPKADSSFPAPASADTTPVGDKSDTPSSSTTTTAVGAASEEYQAPSTDTPKKRKPAARKTRKNDDEASSTVSVNSGMDTTLNSKSVATAITNAADNTISSESSNRAEDSTKTEATTTLENKTQGDTAWVPKSKATRVLPKERTGISPGYLGKNPIPNFRHESRTGQGVAHKDTVPTEAAPTRSATKKTHTDDTSTSSASGWGETSEAQVASVANAGGWGETSSPPSQRVEDDSWDKQAGVTSLSNPDWVTESTGHGSQARRDSGEANVRTERSNTGDRPPRELTGVSHSRESRYSGSRQFPEKNVTRGSQDERANSTRNFQQERTSTSSAPPKDARSSLDKRNERLAHQRGPHPEEHPASRSSGPQQHRRYDAPSEGANSDVSNNDRNARPGPGAPQGLSDVKDDSIVDAGSRRPVQKSETTSFRSSDIRLDPRYNGSNDREGFGSNSSQSSHPGSRTPFTPYQQKNQSSSSLPSQDANRNSTAKPNTSRLGLGKLRLPLLSTSLECQMSWQEMGLEPCVLESIKKAGLGRPSNTQKLMMKPFAEGKDVLAQSQSQNDRTNTLGMALLQKLSASAESEKRCKAVVICSEGISPQKVHKDLEVWFESCPGLRCLFLTDTSNTALSDPEQATQVVVTTLGPLMEVLNKGLIEMSAVETVMISMRSDELVGFDAFKQFWAMLPRGAQVVLMTGLIQPTIQTIKDHNFRANAAVVRADELTLQWSEHYFVDLLESTLERKERQQRERSNQRKYPNRGQRDESGMDSDKDLVKQDDEDEKDTYDRRWEILTNLLTKNPEISHVVIVTQSQSLTQALTDQLKEQNFPVLSIWSMADKTKVVKQFNQPDRCILVMESILMENLDLDHYSLIINYEMPKKSVHYISSFGPFGRSGLRTTMINFCVTQDTKQRLLLEEIEAMHDIRIQEMKLQ